ncbi:hypothetical protein LSH36_61g09043 [Paralvinella palmiformis]|uniref:RING-type domain-containing protein n=1 Tax=Paralvinella palmiformis TaxID=53620 RepID=A0AAD9K486_9ANNE|nr:hypothetical protein LSH36_61g09043 [Paralvinella palmiformis]
MRLPPSSDGASEQIINKQNMADIGSSTNNNEEIISENTEKMDIAEPETKKRKVDVPEKNAEYKLEERLNGILCCAVCLDLPPQAVFQCTNGHLMCASCMAHLLADSRLKDETATCPNCRCEISKSLCIRNLAVEKAISELPATCQYCSKLLPRSQLAHHEHNQCLDRCVLFTRTI